MSDQHGLLGDLPVVILSKVKTTSTAQLDLPNDLLSLILGQTQWSARPTCLALLDHQNAGRTSLKLRWGKDDPESTEQLAGLLAQLPCLEALECVDTAGTVRDVGPIAAVGHHLLSLELTDFLQLEDLAPIGICSQLLSLKIREPK